MAYVKAEESVLEAVVHFTGGVTTRKGWMLALLAILFGGVPQSLVMELFRRLQRRHMKGQPVHGAVADVFA